MGKALFSLRSMYILVGMCTKESMDVLFQLKCVNW